MRHGRSLSRPARRTPASLGEDVRRIGARWIPCNRALVRYASCTAPSAKRTPRSGDRHRVQPRRLPPTHQGGEKEAARLEREKIQQQMPARNRNRRIGLVLIALAVVVVVVAFVVKPGGGSEATGDPPEALLARRPTTRRRPGARRAGNTELLGRPGHRPRSSTTRTSAPPPRPPLPRFRLPHDPTGIGTARPHAGQPGRLRPPPDVYRTIHSMEHARCIIWYAPSAADTAEAVAIRAFYNQPEEGRRSGKGHRGALRLPGPGRAGVAARRRADGARRLAPAADLRPSQPRRSRSTSRRSTGTRIPTVSTSAWRGNPRLDVDDGAKKKRKPAPIPRRRRHIERRPSKDRLDPPGPQGAGPRREGGGSASGRSHRALRRAAVFAGVGLGVFGDPLVTSSGPRARQDPGGGGRRGDGRGVLRRADARADAPGGRHLEPGQSHTYDQHPATSGCHAPRLCRRRGCTRSRWTRPGGALHGARGRDPLLPAAAPARCPRHRAAARPGREEPRTPCSRLTRSSRRDGARHGRVEQAPDVPGAVTADQAATIANGFIDAFVCTSNAPEGKLGEGC